MAKATFTPNPGATIGTITLETRGTFNVQVNPDDGRVDVVLPQSFVFNAHELDALSEILTILENPNG